MKYYVQKIFLTIYFNLFCMGIAYAQDPCANIAGTWKGQWVGNLGYFKCTYDATLKAQYNNSTSQLGFEITVSNPNHKHLCKQGVVFNRFGTCSNGTLHIGTLDTAPYLGNIVGNIMSLNDGSGYGTYSKL